MSPRPYRSKGRQAAAAETRARILEAARALLSAEGTVTFTVDAVAEQANVARMTVYNQFGSKRGLVEALSDDLAARGGIGRLPQAFQARSARAGLKILIQVFIGFWESERLVLRRLRAIAALDPELAGSNRDVRRRQAISVVLKRLGAETGRPAPAAVERMTDLLWVLTAFETYEQLVSMGRSAKETADLIFATAQHLLGPAGAEPPRVPPVRRTRK
jgi:AcrR family transcriptional regulator